MKKLLVVFLLFLVVSCSNVNNTSTKNTTNVVDENYAIEAQRHMVNYAKDIGIDKEEGKDVHKIVTNYSKDSLFYYDLAIEFKNEMKNDFINDLKNIEKDSQIYAFYDTKNNYFRSFFKNNADITKINEKIDNLKTNNKDDIKFIKINNEYLYSRIYTHNPEIYGLDDSNKLQFELLDLKLKQGLYKNKQELLNNLDGEEKNNIDKIINLDSFFERYDVISFTYLDYYLNSKILKDLYFKDNVLHLFFKNYDHYIEKIGYYDTYFDGGEYSFDGKINIDKTKKHVCFAVEKNKIGDNITFNSYSEYFYNNFDKRFDETYYERYKLFGVNNKLNILVISDEYKTTISNLEKCVKDFDLEKLYADEVNCYIKEDKAYISLSYDAINIFNFNNNSTARTLLKKICDENPGIFDFNFDIYFSLD